MQAILRPALWSTKAQENKVSFTVVDLGKLRKKLYFYFTHYSRGTGLQQSKKTKTKC
jgi:hypothetical protein